MCTLPYVREILIKIVDRSVSWRHFRGRLLVLSDIEKKFHQKIRRFRERVTNENVIFFLKDILESRLQPISLWYHSLAQLKF